MKNKYEVRGSIVAIFIDSPKYGMLEAIISLDKLEKVDKYPNSWFVRFHKQRNLFYVQGKITKSLKIRENIFLHRLITDAPDGFVVDHINNDTLDNTDSNLRVITNAENQQNQNGAHRDSKTGIRGVIQKRKTKKWHSYICINNVQKHLGSFDSQEEAIAARIEASKIYFPFSNEAK